jgi:hypothetical protein
MSNTGNRRVYPQDELQILLQHVTNGFQEILVPLRTGLFHDVCRI